MSILSICNVIISLDIDSQNSISTIVQCKVILSRYYEQSDFAPFRGYVAFEQLELFRF